MRKLKMNEKKEAAHMLAMLMVDNRSREERKMDAEVRCQNHTADQYTLQS